MITRIFNNDCTFDTEYLYIGSLPFGGTEVSANWPVIWKMFTSKYPDKKEIYLSNDELIAFVNGLSKELLLENLTKNKELTLGGVSIKRLE